MYMHVCTVLFFHFSLLYKVTKLRLSTFSNKRFISMTRYRHSPKKTALGCTRFYSQSDADQLRRQSLQCSWTSSLQLSADEPQTAGLVIQPFQTVAEDIFIRPVEPKRSVNSPL